MHCFGTTSTSRRNPNNGVSIPVTRSRLSRHPFQDTAGMGCRTSRHKGPSDRRKGCHPNCCHRNSLCRRCSRCLALLESDLPCFISNGLHLSDIPHGQRINLCCIHPWRHHPRSGSHSDPTQITVQQTQVFTIYIYLCQVSQLCMSLHLHVLGPTSHATTSDLLHHTRPECSDSPMPCLLNRSSASCL